jgi:deazaflavin-dependent oxidoreductase (nitroreductase family)
MHEHEPIPASIRLLRRLQPVVVSLLGSPLHGLLSRDVLLLGYRGRKSGKDFTLPLSYAGGDDRLYLCTRPGVAAWWHNLRGGAAVQLRLRGRDLDATASVLDPASPEALEGLRRFVTRNPRTGEMLYAVGRDVAGKPREEDLKREVVRSVVVRLDVAPSAGTRG